MNKTYTLSGELKNVTGEPVVGATVSITPVPPFSIPLPPDPAHPTILRSVNVSATTTVTTDDRGVWSFELYPTPIDKPNYAYQITAESSDGKKLISKKFRMPPSPSSLYTQRPDPDSATVITPCLLYTSPSPRD